MSPDTVDRQIEQEMEGFLTGFFGVEVAQPLPDMPLKAHATLTRCNQPEFYADAPWRLEPDQSSIPLLFVVRDANLRQPGKGPWRLAELVVEQAVADGWRELRRFAPGQLPAVGPAGEIGTGFWSYRSRIPLSSLLAAPPRSGAVARLRVVFAGRFPPHSGPPERVCRTLQVHLARHGLPLGRAADGAGPRRWFYGDTHYHSAYTNDVWEFGNPVRDARYAGTAVGLDWLAITDHSCDLDDRDPENGHLTRWERLRREVSRRSVSDHRFRVILGEEVTLRNQQRGYVHMLILGGLRQMVEGGFWSQDDWLVKKIAQEVGELAAEDGGYPADAVDRLFGTVHTFEEVLAQLPAETLAFAAHPYVAAQPPFINSTWTEDELTHDRLTGHEFWNGRSRRQTDVLVDPTDDPFAEPEWNDPARLAKGDKKRIDKLIEWVADKWEPVLRQGVDGWTGDEDRPALRPVFVAGSDAHGDFNYCVGVGWDYRQHGWISDNALGRARTAIHLPDNTRRHVPTLGRILAALKAGACAVTDGPLIEPELRQGDRVATMGQTLTIGDGQGPRLKAVVHTNPEFGPADDGEVELVVYTAGPGGGATRLQVPVDSPTSITLGGTHGYCRLAVHTTGLGGERFCCFTNPIWLRNPAGEFRLLRIQVTQQMAG